MDERNLLGEYLQRHTLRSEPELGTLFQRLEQVERLVVEQKDFLKRQEAKVRAAEQFDAFETKALPLRSIVLAHS